MATQHEAAIGIIVVCVVIPALLLAAGMLVTSVYDRLTK